MCIHTYLCSHPPSPWATPAQGSASLRPRLLVPYLPSSLETPVLRWPCHQPHHQPAAHRGMATAWLGLGLGAESSKTAPARYYFDSLSLCRCPCRKSQPSPAEGLRTGVRHGPVTSSLGPLPLEGTGRAATDCRTTGNPGLPACGPAIPFPALFPVLSRQPLPPHQLTPSPGWLPAQPFAYPAQAGCDTNPAVTRPLPTSCPLGQSRCRAGAGGARAEGRPSPWLPWGKGLLLFRLLRCCGTDDNPGL